MLTKKSLQSLSTMLKIATCLRVLPYHWNSTTCRLTERKTFFSILPTYLITLDLWSRAIFLLRTFHVQSSNSGSQQSSAVVLVLHFFWLTIYLIAGISACNNILKKDEFLIAINHFYKIQPIFASSEQDKAFKPTIASKLLDYFLRSYPNFIFIQAIMMAAFFYQNPHLPWFYTFWFNLYNS